MLMRFSYHYAIAADVKVSWAVNTQVLQMPMRIRAHSEHCEYTIHENDGLKWKLKLCTLSAWNAVSINHHHMHTNGIYIVWKIKQDVPNTGAGAEKVLLWHIMMHDIANGMQMNFYKSKMNGNYHCKTRICVQMIDRAGGMRAKKRYRNIEHQLNHEFIRGCHST